MNPFADQEARFAQAILSLTEAAKAGGDSVELQDLMEERDSLAGKLDMMRARLGRRNTRISALTQQLEQQSEVIDDVDAVIDGLRNQLGDA